MAFYPNQEDRPLKKARLGPLGPEVYPQDRKQREDELTATNVKHGFSNTSTIGSSEFGSAKESPINVAKVTASFNAILAKKYEYNAFNDQSKKKQILNIKDNFYPAGIPPRGKQFLETWFKDLAGHKPLLMLAKKVPIYNKKEEILQKLCEENVPLSRSAWLIKMNNAYFTTISEAAKSKKRQAMDPFLEWTQVITRYMREQLQKILDHYQGTSSQSGFLTTGNAGALNLDSATKQWNFGAQLAQHMYDEGLLDRHEYLTWLVELLEKVRITDNTVLKLVIALVLRYTSEFVQSNLLARRLTHFCAKRISHLCNEAAGSSPCVHAGGSQNSENSAQTPGAQGSGNNFLSMFSEYCSCFEHRGLLMNLTAIVQSIVLANPTALVWHGLGEGKSASALSGSPLDLLPCPPSSLPMPASSENRATRQQLKAAEEQIVTRSRAAEAKWSSDKRQQSATGAKISSVLVALEALDRHNFERAETSNPLEVLYQKIFGNTVSQAGKDGSGDGLNIDEPVVNVLCEWAVSTCRTGEHRSIVVANLLEKYQSDLLSERTGDGENGEDKDSNISDMFSNGTPPFQALLLKFLDEKAPTLDDEKSPVNRQAFANLILLFCQLIQHDVFSHDLYICNLISRGDLQTASAFNTYLSSYGNPYHSDAASIKSEMGVGKVELHEEIKMELDIHNLHEGDFGAFAFKEEPKSSPDIRQPGSMHGSVEHLGASTPMQALTPLTAGGYIGSGMARTPSGAGPLTPRSSRTPGPHTPGNAHTPGGATPGSVHSTATPGMYHSMAHTPGVAHTPGIANTPASIHGNQSGSSITHTSSEHKRAAVKLFKGPSRHLLFATHFPIASAESWSHESNQRMVVLYGVGKQRDEARHVVKKATKEIGKLIGKKNCIDVMHGEVAKGKKKKEKESELPNYETTFAKFRKLSYHDMHALTNTVSRSLVEVINNFATGSSQLVPVIDSVSHLFDLMEHCLNIGRLLEVCVQLLKDMAEVEAQLVAKSSVLVGTYTTKLCLCIVGVLRKYHSCLLISQDQTASVFESLCKVVKHIDKLTDCTSAERCLLAYLFDLYTSCGYIKSRFADLFSGPSVKVKNTLYVSIEPSSSNRMWEENFAKELMENPKAKMDPMFIRQLNEFVTNRYSFVCSALVNACNCPSVERLNDIAILCAELTACCNALSSEWLGVLKALCWSSNHSCGFIDVLTQVDVGDFSIHDSLAVFTAILIARHCFTLEDLVGQVALQSLLAACPSVGSGGDTDAEMGARLTCHLLLRLFQMMNALPGGSSAVDTRNKGTMYVKASWDRHLLEAAYKRINVGAVVAVLKAILMLGDSCHVTDSMKSHSSKKDTPGDDIIRSMLSLDDDDDDLGDMRLIGGNGLQGGSKERVESAGLSDYAKHCLKEICTQEWVREKFLQEPEQLFTADLLLDKMLSHQQAQHLVEMICYQGTPPIKNIKNEEEEGDDDDSDQKMNVNKKHIGRILENMNQWTQRTSWLELQLMIKQASSFEQLPLLDNIAKATIEVFRHQTDRKLCGNAENDEKTISVWLIAPLISKLAGNVQGRVLKTAGQFLETGNQFWMAKNSKDRERYLQKSTALLGNQSFLSLVLTCLRGQDEQRESLLKSLHDQLEKFVQNAKELQDRVMATDDCLQVLMNDALRLRLSLVGNMFDMIQRSNTLTQDWAILLAQLVGSGVIDVQGNAELFTVVMDMLDVLVHGTLASSDIPEKGEDNKKVYQSLIRKLKKEIGERKTVSIDLLRRLLPLPKVFNEVTVCEAHNGDNRGQHKASDSASGASKQGLQIVRKEKVSPWEILEGHRNTTPLNLSWFGAVKLERKPLKYEEQHRLLLYHSHTLKRPASYYLEPPQVSPEVLEPQTENEDAGKMLEPMQDNKQSSEMRMKNKKQRSNSKDVRGVRLPHGIRPTLTTAGGPQMASQFMQSGQSPGFVCTPEMYAPQGQANTMVPSGWSNNQLQQQSMLRVSMSSSRQNQMSMAANSHHQMVFMKPRGTGQSGYMPGAAGAGWGMTGRARAPAMMRASSGGARAMLDYQQQQAMMGGYNQGAGTGVVPGQNYGASYSGGTPASQTIQAGPASGIMDSGMPQSFSQSSFQGGTGGGMAMGSGGMGMPGKPGTSTSALYNMNMHGTAGAVHQTQMGSSHSRYNTMAAMGGGMQMGGGGASMMNMPPRYNQLQSAAVRQSMAAAAAAGGGAAYNEQQRQAAAVRQQMLQQQQQQLHLQQQQQMQLQQQLQHQTGPATMMMQKQLSGVSQQQQQTNQQFLHRYQ